jgi:CRP/FNR family transcriptional regulator, dissimilatory nitrate respiration regulator
VTASTLIKALHSLPYFTSLDERQLGQLCEQCLPQSFTAGEMIFLENDPAAGLWLIERGRVKIFKVNPDGEEHILHLLGPGNSFNEIAMLDGGSNPAHAATLTQAQVWLLPSAAVHQLIASDSVLAAQVIQFLAERVRTLVGQIEDLALYSVTVRLARFLLKQAEDPALTGVTRTAIAAYLATTPETISRALRSLEQAQAIRFDRHRIVIVREDVLRTIAAL